MSTSSSTFIHSFDIIRRKFCVLCLPYIKPSPSLSFSLCIHTCESHSHNRKTYDYYLLKMLVMLFYYLSCSLSLTCLLLRLQCGIVCGKFSSLKHDLSTLSLDSLYNQSSLVELNSRASLPTQAYSLSLSHTMNFLWQHETWYV
jgi:hypothetical protein